MKVFLLIIALGGNSTIPMDSMKLCLLAASQVNQVATETKSKTTAICIVQGQ